MRTVVIGAGIAGLAYAHARGEGADLIVLEAREVAGGLIRTAPTPDGHVELGPEALQDNAPETNALLDELQLAPLPSRAEAAKRFVLDAAGRPRALPSNPSAFLRSPLLSWRGKLRALSEPFRARDRALDGSVADFLRHRVGREVVERLVDPAISGIYAGDPELLSARACFPAVVEMVERHGSLFAGLRARGRERRAARAAGTARAADLASAASAAGAAGGESSSSAADAASKGPALLSLPGGLQRLPEALAERLGARLRLNTPVAGLQRDAKAWRIQLEADALTADELVLAVPAPVGARLLAQIAPSLSQQLASMRAENVVSVAHRWARADLAHPLDGFGVLVPSSLGKRHLGTLFSSSIVPGRCGDEHVLLRTLLGGARRPELVDAPDAELLDIVQHEVGELLDARAGAAPNWSLITRWPNALPRYDLEQPARQHAIDAALAELPGLTILGNHRRGISVNALIANSRETAREHAAGAGAPSADHANPASHAHGDHDA